MVKNPSEANMFPTAAEKHQQEQLEHGTKGKKPSSQVMKRQPKRGPDATTLTVTISRADKLIIQEYAAMHMVSISDLAHEWAQNLKKRKEQEENKK